MPPIRFRTRHLHATFYNHLRAELTMRGWVNDPVNFGATGLSFMDYPPDERATQIKQNTVAVAVGDYGADEDAEVGARGGGLRRADYHLFIDVYMEEQSLTLALCDDIRDIYTDYSCDLIDQITGQPVPFVYIEVEEVGGPERPSSGVDAFQRYWRTMNLDLAVYFQS